MSPVFMFSVVIGVGLLLLVLYALLTSAKDSDADASYMEEYGEDDDFDYWNE